MHHTFEQTCRNGQVSHSTVDHFVLSPRLLPLILDCGVIHRGDNLSVHSPIWVKLKVGALPIKKKAISKSQKKPSWSKASQEQVDGYTAALQQSLSVVTVPNSLMCQDVHCKDKKHSEERDSMMLDILCSIVETSYVSLPLQGGRSKSVQGGPVPGWSEEVKPYRA